MYEAIIRGTGSCVPSQRLTNHELEQRVETSHEWIVTRTGIEERRIAAPEEATSDFAYEAARLALADAGLQAEEIDLIVVGTTTADYKVPSVASQVQHRLGCRNVAAFDVQATCVGFLTALQVAEQFVKSGRYRHALVIGADTISRITDYTDRVTCILFADGAGACVLSGGNESQGMNSRGVLHSATHSAGEHLDALYVPGGGSRHPHPDEKTPATIVMEGRRVFKLAVQAMSQTVWETLTTTGYEKDALDWLIPHQANERIFQAVAEQLDFPMEKVVNNIRCYGNNSAATIPLALDLARKDGRIKKGDLVMLTAFGGGLVWGSALVRM